MSSAILATRDGRPELKGESASFNGNSQHPHLSLVCPPQRFQTLPDELVDGPGPAAYVTADGSFSNGEIIRPYPQAHANPPRKVWRRSAAARAAATKSAGPESSSDAKTAHVAVHDQGNRPLGVHRPSRGEVPHRNTLSGTRCLPNKPFVRAGVEWHGEIGGGEDDDAAHRAHLARTRNANAAAIAEANQVNGAFKAALPWFCGKDTNEALQSYAATIYNRTWNRAVTGDIDDAVHKSWNQNTVDTHTSKLLHHKTYDTYITQFVAKKKSWKSSSAPAANSGGMSKSRVEEKADVADGDGEISRAEYLAAGGDQSGFDRHDWDGGGTIDREELLTMAAAQGR